MNYTQLLQAVQDYCENDETTFVSQIPTFVANTEQKIYRSVNLKVGRKSQTGTVTVNNAYLTAPTDMLRPFELAYTDGSGNQIHLLHKDVGYIREVYPDSTDTGAPEVYALFDNDSFILGPTPDSSYACEIHYYYFPESIVTAATSWLGTNAQEALLFGSVMEGYIFMKGSQDLVQYYDTKYKEALMLLNAEQELAIASDSFRPDK